MKQLKRTMKNHYETNKGRVSKKILFLYFLYWSDSNNIVLVVKNEKTFYPTMIYMESTVPL